MDLKGNDETDLKCPKCGQIVLIGSMSPALTDGITYRDITEAEKRFKANIIRTTSLYCSRCNWEQNWKFDEDTGGSIKVE